MSESFGSGVSRTLSALQRAFTHVVFQAGKPPLDAEFNLQDSIALESLRQTVRASMHSGFLLDPTDALRDFKTNSSWSNLFQVGRQAAGELDSVLWANVGGWMIPVMGTNLSEGNTSNQVRLNPPPDTDARIDLIFLEAWSAQVAPNPSTTNKPSASTIWKVGNVEYGGMNFADDIEDPTIGFETTERVQVQYRIRVFGSGAGLGTSVALDVYPDGLDDPNVLGQGTATAPVVGMTWTNMREQMGDPSLWRAGDGSPSNSLGTTDGYTYAIPICAIFRRNSQPFTAIEVAGNPNQNGAFDRNPSAVYLTDPRDGAKVLTTAVLGVALTTTTTGIVQVTNLVGSGIDDTHINLSATFLIINGEVIGISAVNTTAGTVTIPVGGRGRDGTMARNHDIGAEITFFNTRPDGAFADEIQETDILDLRRGVTTGEWNYQQLLIHNLSKLLSGQMRSSYKQSLGDTEGPCIVEVDTLYANGSVAVPNQTEALDGPDGIRTVFSDSAAIQPGVTFLCDEGAPQASGYVTSFDATVEWDVGADFKPSGFMTDATGFANGTVIFLHIGGDSGTEGARATFRDGSTRAVRFLSPKEYWKTGEELSGLQQPVQIRFITEAALTPAAGSEVATEHPGPMYPLYWSQWEKPFMFLGGLLNSSLQVGGVALANIAPELAEVEFPGFDFDAVGDWWNGTDITSLDTTGIANTLLRGQRTLYDMLTKGGTDRSGESSEVYIVLYGDDTNADNNGVFHVVGAGTAGYTYQSGTAAGRLAVKFISAGVTQFVLPTAAAITAEVRSQETNSEDGSGFASGVASAVIVMTDLEGTEGSTKNPWNAANLAVPLVTPLVSKLEITTALQYHPGRGGTARVADIFGRVSVVDGGSEYLRQPVSILDPTFPTATGVPDNETFFPSVHVSVWNRLRGLGLDAPNAPDYGGNVVAQSEQDREAEVFFDRGSKTLVFRPFLDRSMTLQAITIDVADGTIIPSTYPVLYGGFATDGAGIFTAGLRMGFPVPPAFMPRFGRQDIPYRKDMTGGAGTFLEGVNHLFTDAVDETEPQFYVVGGQDNMTGGNLVQSLYVQTGSTSGLTYGRYGTIAGPATPAYQGRLMVDTVVMSSDLGRVLRGIEMPPFLGLARIYGVYDRRDFINKGGSTYEADRVTPTADPATNLLITDNDRQTVFIRQGGASDVTTNDGDHTYIIPSNAIDITKSPFYVASDEFDDLEYVVECVVFGFSRNFINGNNYVLARRHNGQGAAIHDGDVIEAEGVRMTIPAPATLNDEMYVGYTRTVYQGDPYMTRAGSTRTVSDYETRYGQITTADAFDLNVAIQQYDINGDGIPQTPNIRALQVLAALDFTTTMGTGKVGGAIFEGTCLDCGHIESAPAAHTRVPAALTTPAWRVVPRTFSESQQGNPERAFIRLVVYDNTTLAGGETVTVTDIDGIAYTVTAVVGAPGPNQFQIGADETATAVNLAGALSTAANHRFYIYNDKDAGVTVQTRTPGGIGNSASVSFSEPMAFVFRDKAHLSWAQASVTMANLSGGTDFPYNAGGGTSQLDLTGLTERLPLGILMQDSDFLCENPLHDDASAFVTHSAVIHPVQSVLPLTRDGGDAYTRFLGGAGQWLGMADGGILAYEAYDASTAPGGSRNFRLYRGGGSAYVLSGPNPGGPVDWAGESMPSSLQPTLKGGILICKALLVRNFREKAFATLNTVSHGDEIQMVILTQGRIGDGSSQEEGLNLSGLISPTGYGEGYAAADRYRLEGKPLVSGAVRAAPDMTTVDLAVFPDTPPDNTP